MRPILVFMIAAFMVMQPCSSWADRLQNVYLGYVLVADHDRTSVAQRQLLVAFMDAVRQALRKAPHVIVDSPYPRSSWSMDRDWKDVAQLGKTHFLIGIPIIERVGVVRITWEVGEIGIVDGAKVPVFGAALTEAFDTRILKDGDDAVIEDLQPRAKAAVIADQMRKIFPELSPTFSYYVKCFDAEPTPPDILKWSERRERLLTQLLMRLTERTELEHANASIDPREEARAACSDDVTGREAAKIAARKADFLLRGVTSDSASPSVALRMTVENRPGLRRLHNDLTYQPNQVALDFYTKLLEWGSHWPGNIRWEISVCGKGPELWGNTPNFEAFANALATKFQEKLPMDVRATVDNDRACSS